MKTDNTQPSENKQLNGNQSDEATCSPVSAEQRDELERLAKPLMKWLEDNWHPHVKIVMDNMGMELLEGVTTVRRNYRE